MDEGPVDWISSGDLAKIDEDGFLKIIGRIKETITLRNTRKINATIVEDLLTHHDVMKEVAAKGTPNQQGFDDLHVFINSRFRTRLTDSVRVK